MQPSGCVAPYLPSYRRGSCGLAHRVIISQSKNLYRCVKMTKNKESACFSAIRGVQVRPADHQIIPQPQT
jgi:hypothetical protein